MSEDKRVEMAKYLRDLADKVEGEVIHAVLVWHVAPGEVRMNANDFTPKGKRLLDVVALTTQAAMRTIQDMCTNTPSYWPEGSND